MRGYNLYPQLDRWFKTCEEMSNETNISRSRLYRCLYGHQEFTEKEKRAIWNAVLVKQHNIEVSGDFDAQFKRKAG